jgi:hypothetical protein
MFLLARWSSLVARRAHNPKVVGSNPARATKEALRTAGLSRFCDLALNFDPMSDDHTRDDVGLAALRASLDGGIGELDDGLGVETTPEDLMAEVFTEVGLA